MIVLLDVYLGAGLLGRSYECVSHGLCLVVLSFIEHGAEQSPTIIVELSIYPLNSVNLASSVLGSFC